MAATRLTASRRHGLPPVIGRDALVLILGSFPGEASLQSRQYYAHPRNQFWPILAALLDEPLVTMDYAARLARLETHRVAVWDTIVTCERSGSLDTAIRNAERGEIGQARALAPGIGLVCFNGRTAARAEPAWRSAGYATLALPSSSPAYTRPFAEKLEAWRVIAKTLEACR